MTQTTKPISPLRQRMIDDMRMRKLSDKTQSHYIRAVVNFTRFLGRSPDTATAEDLRRYQLHLVETGTSRIMLNATITALRFFFGVTLDRPEALAKMSPVREPRKLPVVLSREEVARLIEAAGNPKYQAALSVAYGAGLRASEVVALKVGDIDSTRMTLRIEQGKGRKDRYAMLSPGAARAPARLVAGGPCAGQDARGRLAVPRAEPGQPADHPPAQPHLSCRGGRGGDRQARLDAHPASQLRHPSAGAEGGYPRDPGAARAQASWRPPRSIPRWPPRCCARWSVHWSTLRPPA